MSQVKDRLEARIRDFVADIAALVRDEAIAVVTGAAGAIGGARAGRPARAAGAARPARAARPAGAARPARAPAGRNGLSGRRDGATMKRDMDRLVAYVRAHPGAKMEEIAAAVGSTSQRLNRPMHKLVASRALRRKGEKRASRYWVGGR